MNTQKPVELGSYGVGIRRLKSCRASTSIISVWPREYLITPAVHRLKQALLNAKAIASGDPNSSASGTYFANLIERLRIADAIKPKLNAYPTGAAALETVANGEVDLAIWVIISANGPDTELAGVLPAKVWKFTSYAAGILTNSNQKQAAKALLSFISSPTALAIMKSQGFGPT